MCFKFKVKQHKKLKQKKYISKTCCKNLVNLFKITVPLNYEKTLNSLKHKLYVFFFKKRYDLVILKICQFVNCNFKGNFQKILLNSTLFQPIINKSQVGQYKDSS